MQNNIPPVVEDRGIQGTCETHESYGIVGLNRQYGHENTDLFGSSVRHNTLFTLRIARAEKHRSLNRDWFSSAGRKPLIEIQLSPTQLVDLFTSPNIGDGVPCTIHQVDGKHMDGCPSTDTRRLFEQEFDERMKDITNTAKGLENQAKEMLTRKGTLKKAEKENLLNIITMLVQDIRSNVPFVQSQFNEAMDNTVKEAKGEVEGFFTNKVQSLGLEALQGELRALLMPNDDDEQKRIEESDGDVL